MHQSRGIEAFAAVAEQRSFSAAARALGVTASALSQSVRAFEERIGVPLLVRSTRSVRLTDAGERLFERLGPVLKETAAALDEARGSLDVARGTLRLSAGRLTVPLVIEPVLPALLAEHPELSVEVAIDDRFIDIVEKGFDAGVRLSESIQPDFSVVRLTSSFRLLVAGSPSYFARHGRPTRPRDLVDHDCINYRMSSTGSYYEWEFERRGKELKVAVKGRLSCNDGVTMVNAAVAGLGLVYIHEQAIRPHVERGELEVVLSDYATSVPGFFLYFPRRAGVQPKLRAFIDVARRVLKPAAATVASEPRAPRRRR
ncbi:MAG: LysR substrate-binding domain-containing protein [Polyangiaceae bacterium]